MFMSIINEYSGIQKFLSLAYGLFYLRTQKNKLLGFKFRFYLVRNLDALPSSKKKKLLQVTKSVMFTF